MTSELEKIVNKLTNDGKNVISVFGALSPEQAEREFYTSELDVWKVKHVLAHLIFAEQEFLNLFANILAGGEGAREGFDVDQYNFETMVDFKDRTLEQLMAEFERTRVETIDFIQKLSEVDVQKVGRHPALGVTSLLDMIKMIYVHSQMHTRDVKKINS